MATYIGVAVYILLYVGYAIYDRFVLRSPYHFVPTLKVDLETDAVWKRGEGESIKQRESEAERTKDEGEALSYSLRHWVRRLRTQV